jgi:hypothetical protein
MKPGQEFANFFLKRMGIPQISPVYYPDHLMASELIERIGMQKFASYFSFGFVRNPWDREVSTYRYILKNRKHVDHLKVTRFKDFDTYLRWRCDGRFQLQQDFLYHNGKQVVDFIGRFENLVNDFQVVCKRLGLRRRLPALNKTTGARYERYYNNELVELVQSTYRRDIDEFGFQFGQSASQAA